MKMKLEHHIYLCDLSFRIKGNKNNNLKENWEMFIWLASTANWIISTTIADVIISSVFNLVTSILIGLLAVPLFFILVD